MTTLVYNEDLQKFQKKHKSYRCDFINYPETQLLNQMEEIDLQDKNKKNFLFYFNQIKHFIKNIFPCFN